MQHSVIFLLYFGNVVKHHLAFSVFQRQTMSD